MSDTAALLAALMGLAVQASAPSAVQAQETPPLAGRPSADAGHAQECYAKVKFGAQYGVAPPTGPHYSWRQEPGPPGAPGPIWCLVSEVSAPRQILISPERYGWIRVLCEAEATSLRIAGVQRQLSAAGVYQGPLDGRYDLTTTQAVQRFQDQRHIEDRGYLGAATLSALNVYAQSSYQPGSPTPNGYYQVPYPYPQAAYPQGRPWTYGYGTLTTFDTGVLTWPGKR